MKTKSQAQTSAFVNAYTKWAIKTCNTRAETEKGIANALKSYEVTKKMSIREAFITMLHEGALKNHANYANAIKERAALSEYPEFAKAFFAKYLINKSLWDVKAGSMSDLPPKLVETVKDIAFGELFAGSRLQKIYSGRNSVNSQVRTESNGKFGWDKVVWHYADYTIIINKSKTKVLVKIGVKFDIAKITKEGVISPVFGRTITI